MFRSRFPRASFLLPLHLPPFHSRVPRISERERKRGERTYAFPRRDGLARVFENCWAKRSATRARRWTIRGKFKHGVEVGRDLAPKGGATDRSIFSKNSRIDNNYAHVIQNAVAFKLIFLLKLQYIIWFAQKHKLWRYVDWLKFRTKPNICTIMFCFCAHRRWNYDFERDAST